MSIQKMRTAPQLAAEYKAAGPNTPVNPHFLRNLINSGEIPFVKAGKKYLINADILAQYLEKGQVNTEATDQRGIIRAIRA